MISKNKRTSGKLKLIILLIVGGLLGAGGSFFFIGRAKADSNKKHERKNSDEETKVEDEAGKNGKSEEHITYIGLGAFLVNLGAETGMHYLRVEISVGVELPVEKKKKGGHGGGAKAPVLPPADDAIARDAIVRTLSAQSYDELKTQGPGDALKEKLIASMSESLQECKIHTVMFTSFVLQ